MTQPSDKIPGVFAVGDEVFTTHASRLYHGVVEALGPERYEVQVRADNGELLTVHKYNVEHAEHQLTIRDHARIHEELEQVPGSAFEQAKIWRETVDQHAFAKLEVKVIMGEATDEERAEYDRLLETHPGQDRLQAELVPALRAARAEFRQTLS